jgi:hypothetical protein
MPKKLLTAALSPIINGGLIFYKNQVIRTSIRHFIDFFDIAGSAINEIRSPLVDQLVTPDDPANGFKFIDFLNDRNNVQFVLLEKKFNGDQSKYAIIELGTSFLLDSLAGNKVTFLDKKPKSITHRSFSSTVNYNALTEGYYIFDDNSFEPIYPNSSYEVVGTRANIIGACINDSGINDIYNSLKIVPHVLLNSDKTLEYYPQTITTYANSPFTRKDYIDLKEYFRLYSPITNVNSLVENEKSVPNTGFQEIDDSAIQGKTLISLQQDNERGLALSDNGEVFSVLSSYTPARLDELRLYEAPLRPSLRPVPQTGSVTLTVVSYRQNKPLTVFPASLNIPDNADTSYSNPYGTANSLENITTATTQSFTLIVSQANYVRNNISVPEDWGLTSQEVSDQISRSSHKKDGAGRYVFKLQKENASGTTSGVHAIRRPYNYFALSQEPVPFVTEIPYTKTITPTLPTVSQQSSLPNYSSISVTVPYSATVQQVEDLLNAAVGANTNTTIPKFKVCDSAGSVWRHPSDLTTRSLRLAGVSDSRRRDRPFFLTSNTRDVYEYTEYSVGGTTYNSGEWDYHARDSTVITRERLPQETEWVTHVSFTNNTIEDPLLFTTYTGAALYGNPMTDGNLTANRFAGGFRCCHTSKLDSDVQRVEYASNEDMRSAQKVFFKWEKINVYNNKPVSKIVIQKNLSPSFIFTDGSIFLPYDGLGFFPKSGLLAGKNVIDISCSNSRGSVFALILCSDGSLFSVAGSANVDSLLMGVSVNGFKITSGKLYPISFSRLTQSKIVKVAVYVRGDHAACYALSETGEVFRWGVYKNGGVPSLFINKSVTTLFDNIVSYSSLSLPDGLILNIDGSLTGTVVSEGDFIAKIKVSLEDLSVQSSFDEPPIFTKIKSSSDFIDIPIQVLPEPVSQQTVVDNNIVDPINEPINPNQNSTGSSTNQVTLFSIPIDLSVLNSRSKLIQLSFTMSRINTSTPKQQSYRISFGNIDVLNSLLTLSSSSSTSINLTVKINKISSSGLNITSEFNYNNGTPPTIQSKSILLSGLVNQDITLYATNEAGLSAPIISTKSGPIITG